MATFTFRISEDLRTHLNSAKMRSWIAEFISSPRQLPPDPGPSNGRISLTLPSDHVRELAALLHCEPSAALRRLAAERLAFISNSAPASIPRPGVPESNPRVSKATPDQSSVSRSTSLKDLVEKKGRLASLRNKTCAPMPDKNSEGGQGWFLLASAVAFLAFLFFGFGNGNTLE